MAALLHMPTDWQCRPTKRCRHDMHRLQPRTLEDERAYTLLYTLTDVPGVTARSVTVSVVGNDLLKVMAKRTNDEHDVMQHTLRLADDADMNSVSAVCSDGMLEVKVNKLRPPLPLSITIQTSEPPSVEADCTRHLSMKVRKKVPGLTAAEFTVTFQSPASRSKQSYQLVIDGSSTKGYGDYHYSFKIPDDAAVEHASAFCCNGVLHVHVPRREPVRLTVPVHDHPATAMGEEQLTLARVKVPGYTTQQITLEVTQKRLRIRATNLRSQAMERVVALPDRVDLGRLHAEFVQGLLTVWVPKSGMRQNETRQVLVAAGRCR